MEEKKTKEEESFMQLINYISDTKHPPSEADPILIYQRCQKAIRILKWVLNKQMHLKNQNKREGAYTMIDIDKIWDACFTFEFGKDDTGDHFIFDSDLHIKNVKNEDSLYIHDMGFYLKDVTHFESEINYQIISLYEFKEYITMFIEKSFAKKFTDYIQKKEDINVHPEEKTNLFDKLLQHHVGET